MPLEARVAVKEFLRGCIKGREKLNIKTKNLQRKVMDNLEMDSKIVRPKEMLILLRE